jgi:prepilin-type N-terminal cleavage/methylation domain-containing protein/prepilin-type processing-associated H-X9-DG protein
MTHRTHRGFTLIELVVVVGIIGVLLGLLLPAVQYAREAARRARCAHNLKQIALGMHSYLSAVGTFPPGYVSTILPSPVFYIGGEDGGPGWSGHALLLPHLEQTSLYNTINFNLAVSRPENTTTVLTSLSVFNCPSDGARQPSVVVPDAKTGAPLAAMATANYVMSAGTVRPTCRVCRDQFDGVFGRDLAIGPAEISDGLSQTFGGGERAWKWAAATAYGVVPQSKMQDHIKPDWFALGPGYVLGTTFKQGFNVCPEPFDDPKDEFYTTAESFGSMHPGGSHFWLCDGSVRFFQDTIDIRLSWDFATRAGDPKWATIHW